MTKNVLIKAIDEKSRIDKKVAKKLLNERDYRLLFKKIVPENSPPITLRLHSWSKEPE